MRFSEISTSSISVTASSVPPFPLRVFTNSPSFVTGSSRSLSGKHHFHTGLEIVVLLFRIKQRVVWIQYIECICHSRIITNRLPGKAKNRGIPSPLDFAGKGVGVRCRMNKLACCVGCRCFRPSPWKRSVKNLYPPQSTGYEENLEAQNAEDLAKLALRNEKWFIPISQCVSGLAFTVERWRRTSAAICGSRSTGMLRSASRHSLRSWICATTICFDSKCRYTTWYVPSSFRQC